jgi:hypothetical protein
VGAAVLAASCAVGSAELSAQTYLADVYAELEILYPDPEPSDSTVTIWLALNIDQSGIRLRFDPTSDALPTAVWWSRPDRSGQPLWQSPCATLTRAELTESCGWDWPASFSKAELQRRLVASGALPLPRRRPITEVPPPPCPEDGWDLMIRRAQGGAEREIHYCNFEYRWQSRESPQRVITELREAWSVIEGGVAGRGGAL